jgi:hypothetical protein
MPQIILRVLLFGSLSFYLAFQPTFARQAYSQNGAKADISDTEIIISKLQPEQEKGLGYHLVYWVDAPLAVFWQFKTDFDNDFLVTNNYIKSHRFITRKGNVVITENEYASKPGRVFRWQTTVRNDLHRLEFKLLNPTEAGQNFHYGYIQLEGIGKKSKVTQVAYFDFFGVSLWVNYPFFGGMEHYLNDIARWEQKTILKLKDHY